MIERLVAIVVLVAGCRYQGSFVCETNDQCGASGTCQPTHYCSFGDSSCPSGQKYDDTAAGHAGQCVDELPADAAVDVYMPDAFDVATCPATYNVRIASSTSYYQVLTDQKFYWVHMAACASGLAGATHLVIPDSAQEITELGQYIQTLTGTGSEFYVGIVQDATVTIPTDGWIRFDGQPIDPAVWLNNEPNDFDGDETDHYSQVGAFDKANKHVDDVPGPVNAGAVCECDGKTITPQAQAFIDADPMNPN